MKLSAVQVRREPAVLPTYTPEAPDKNPMFLEKRVYQGSSGRIYPLPFIDRISETKKNVAWDAVHLENEFLYVMILPQIGGRIHILRARHLLANASDIWFWLGEACFALGDKNAAKQWWSKAADFRGDFQQMSVRTFSEIALFSILSLKRLGRQSAAGRLATGLLAYAKQLAGTPAKIDYFATSLPSMLLFDEDLQARQKITARFLIAQASFCLERKTLAVRLAREVLASDPSHGAAADFLTFAT